MFAIYIGMIEISKDSTTPLNRKDHKKTTHKSQLRIQESLKSERHKSSERKSENLTP